VSFNGRDLFELRVADQLWKWVFRAKPYQMVNGVFLQMASRLGTNFEMICRLHENHQDQTKPARTKRWHQAQSHYRPKHKGRYHFPIACGWQCASADNQRY
jgi:hypothetical protein